jgi:hypothetical protein
MPHRALEELVYTSLQHHFYLGTRSEETKPVKSKIETTERVREYQ